MEKIEDRSRREFLKTSAALTGGFIVGFHFGSPLAQGDAAIAAKGAMVYPPDAFIQIAPDESITMVINKLEMGQGVFTSMAQLLAEELECDWSKISCVSAP